MKRLSFRVAPSVRSCLPAVLAVLFSVVWANPVAARLAEVDALCQRAGIAERALPRLLFDMAVSDSLSSRVLAAADGDFRALTDSLVSLLSKTEPEARAVLPGLYRVQDLGPGPGERPPAWPEVQWQGLLLARRIAPDPSVGRDHRLLRELDEAMGRIDRPRAAAVNGVVLLWVDWFAERGEDPALTHDPARIPDLTPWLRRLSLPVSDPAAWRAPRLLADLDSRPWLRVRLEKRLDPGHHAFLAAELMESLMSGPEEFASAGIEPAHYDPSTARIAGHEVLELWRLALELLDHVTDHVASGLDLDTRTVDRVQWWRAAQYEARHWRDPHDAPDFARWLDAPGPEAGGWSTAVWIREIYVAEAIRDRIVEQLDERQAWRVPALIDLLAGDREHASALGFRFGFYRPEFRRTPTGPGVLTAIPWPWAKRWIRYALARITGDPGPSFEVDESAADAYWLDWWAHHRDDPRYGGEGSPLPLETERGRVR